MARRSTGGIVEKQTGRRTSYGSGSVRSADGST